MSEPRSANEDSRYDLGLLFTDGLPDLDDSAGYRGAIAAKAAGISYRQLTGQAPLGLESQTGQYAITLSFLVFGALLIVYLIRRR